MKIAIVGGGGPASVARVAKETVKEVIAVQVKQKPVEELFSHGSRYQIHQEIMDHINGKRSFRMEYDLIQKKQSTLSKRCRDYVVSVIENP